MDILYLLIPLSALLVLALIGLFGWALQRGQFDDLDHEGERILQDEGELPRGDSTAASSALDVDQGQR